MSKVERERAKQEKQQQRKQWDAKWAAGKWASMKLSLLMSFFWTLLMMKTHCYKWIQKTNNRLSFLINSTAFKPFEWFNSFYCVGCFFFGFSKLHCPFRFMRIQLFIVLKCVFHFNCYQFSKFSKKKIQTVHIHNKNWPNALCLWFFFFCIRASMIKLCWVLNVKWRISLVKTV